MIRTHSCLCSVKAAFLLVLLLVAMPSSMAAGSASPIGPSGALLSSAPLGADDFLSGLLPPSGVYWLDYVFHYHASGFKDAAGDTIKTGPLDGFKTSITGNVYRFLWMPEQDIRIFGGRWAPDFGIVQLYKRLKVGGQWHSDSGMGDLIFAPVNLFYRWGDLHTLLYVDFIAPTGDYGRRRVVNLGNNHWTIKPAALLTYARPKWEVTGIFNVDFNTKNPDYIDPRTGLDTSHRSGNSFHMDYAASWRPTPRWNLGISGYYVDDLKDDQVGGQRVRGTQTRAFAFGPGVRYQWGPVGLVAKWQHEVVAENRPQGDCFWLRFILPL